MNHQDCLVIYLPLKKIFSEKNVENPPPVFEWVDKLCFGLVSKTVKDGGELAPLCLLHSKWSHYKWVLLIQDVEASVAGLKKLLNSNPGEETSMTIVEEQKKLLEPCLSKAGILSFVRSAKEVFNFV